MTSRKEPFDGDDLLSETYRELGVEKTPEHLNQSVLRMASVDGEASDTRNSLFAAWMKPVAWAATIGLSLAIVLEYSELPTAPVQSDSVPGAGVLQGKTLEPALETDAAANEEETPEKALQTNAVANEKVEKRARSESAPSRQRLNEDELRRGSAALDEQVINSEAKVELNAVTAPAAPRQDPLSTKTGTSAAKERAASYPADSQPMTMLTSSMEQTESDNLCDATARLSKESWQTCIDQLRSAGNEEVANREYEAFILVYPDETSGMEANR